MDNQEKACIAIILALSVRPKARCHHKRWVTEWIAKGKIFTHINFLNEIILMDMKDYNYFRMNEVTYKKL